MRTAIKVLAASHAPTVCYTWLLLRKSPSVRVIPSRPPFGSAGVLLSALIPVARAAKAVPFVVNSDQSSIEWVFEL